MTGSIGVLQPGIPVNLQVIARKAQPIASSLVTANLDAQLRVTGTILGRIDIAGTMHVNRAVIGIPDSLPPEVVVLDVRRRGQAAPAAPAKQIIIGFDVAIQAPREILVQGRGLDAELGGELHLSGTSDAPQVSGGFRPAARQLHDRGKQAEFHLRPRELRRRRIEEEQDRSDPGLHR